MEVRYYIDPDSRQPHIYQHGVVEQEVEEVCGDRERIAQGVKDHGLRLGKREMGATCV